MNKWIILLAFIFVASIAYAQEFGFGFTDFPPNRADQMFTSTDNFSGILSASDVTVQLALETLAFGAGAGGITGVGNNCTAGVCLNGDDSSEIELDSSSENSKIYFANKTGSGDTYFEFDPSAEQVHLYVSGTKEQSWPSITTTGFLLLDDGTSYLLLNDGTSKLKL